MKMLFDINRFSSKKITNVQIDSAWDDGSAFPSKDLTVDDNNQVEICDKSIYVQESAQVSALQDCNSDLNSLELRKQTPIAQTSFLSDTQESITTAVSNPLPLEDLDLKEEPLKLSQLPHLAPPSRLKGIGKGQKMKETVSPQSCELLKITNPNSQPSKTSRDCSTVPTPKVIADITLDSFSDGFTNAGMMQNGFVLEADILPPPSLEKEYCWLPSPGALSTGKGRPPGQTKQEAWLKKQGLIQKGEVLNPAILCEWYKIPITWLDPSELRKAAELLENNERQQETFSILESQRSPSKESSTLIVSFLKAVSLWQPWASLIPLNLKRYETRSWKTNYRGKLLICSTAKSTKVQYQQYLKICNEVELPTWDETNFPHGQAIALCDLTDCIQVTPEFIAQQSQTEILCGDWQVGRYAWKLENIQFITESFTVKGKQGLFNIYLTNIQSQKGLIELLKSKTANSKSCISTSLHKFCPQCNKSLNSHENRCNSCGWIFLKVGDCVKVLNPHFGELGLITKILKFQNNGWVNVDSRQAVYHVDCLEFIPENFLEENREAAAQPKNSKRRERKGCLYKYLENKKLKDGRIVSYPRITENHRDPDNPKHWRWGFNWEEKIDGEWKGRSIGSVPVGAIPMIQSMRSRGVPLEEIIDFIKKSKRNK